MPWAACTAPSKSSTEEVKLTDTIRDRTSEFGEPVGKVVLQVDYQIIEHFSENLYDSPNKAIEELVANGFDAFATLVHVFTPGPFTADRIVVWDNGESMDVDGLKQLWWIAKSPKLEAGRVQKRDGRTRKLIGKFGIGKLASYAVGRVISHLCRHGDEFYLVSVDYGEIHGNGGRPAVSTENPITRPVLKLQQEKARDLVESLFDTPPESLGDLFDQRSWTLAIVEDLKVEDLPKGRLMWVLGNGMPLRPDFTIKVNEDRVKSKLAKKAAVEWDFGTKRVVEVINNYWDDAVKEDHFDRLVSTGEEVGLDPSAPDEPVPYVELAHLGKVWGSVRLFEETLLKFRSADSGRSHGFFLVIRGRLTNPEDAELFLPDPSFQTFYKSQFVIHADELDDELLADRERLRRNEATEELALLQRAVYAAARVAVESLEAERAEEQSTRSILPVGSRSFYRAPLNALLVKTPIEQVPDFDPASPKVERKPLGEDQPIAVMSLEEGAFHINTSHPYYVALEKRIGKGRRTREFLRTFDLFAISERLLEGHLYELGLEEDEIKEIITWREGLFRQLARSYDDAPEVINEAYRTSSLRGRPFEEALHKVFQEMGYAANHAGKKGEEDILVVAMVGPESYSFIVEAKGSKGKVSNKDAAVGAAANHREAVGAEHAVIVAREFGGFGSTRDDRTAALYKECSSTGGVSFMELDALEEVHRAIDRFSYPLPLLRDVFTVLETPAEKLARIAGLTTPTVGFDYSALLVEIWRRQGDEARDQAVPYLSVYQQGPWKARIEFPDFERRLVALETLAAGRVHVNTTREVVYLRQAPDLILAQIDKSLHGEGYDIPEAPDS